MRRADTVAVKRHEAPDVTRMNDVQLLAHLLDMAGLETTAAREASHSLLDAHEELESVLRQPKKVLLNHPLLGENAAAFLLLLPAMMERYTSTTATTTVALESKEDLVRLLAPHFSHQGFERLCAFLLGDGFQPITSITVAQGGRSAVSCSTRRVLELALNHRAHGVILAHNHPDGVPSFSKTDLVSTNILMQELKLIGVPLVDHYLLADGRIVSMRQYTDYLRSMGLLMPHFLDWFPTEK